MARALGPSISACTCATPPASAVTRPPADTVATTGLSLVQLKGRPTIRVPMVSRATAVNCPCQAIASADVSGETVTVLAGKTMVVPVVKVTAMSASRSRNSLPPTASRASSVE